MSGLAFVDTETTGLDPDRHEVWEVALIVDEREHVWQLPVDLGRADPVALRISGYHERRVDATQLVSLPTYAEAFARLTRGRHLVGAVPSFDEERLRKLLRANGACPEWHYHLIDVEALAVGYLRGMASAYTPPLPWRSDDLSVECGAMPPSDDDRHTALGDARWAKRLYEAICGSGGEHTP